LTVSLSASISNLLLTVLLVVIPIAAAEKPYFVTYDHRLEEPGNLELSIQPVVAFPSRVPGFAALSIELEYGLKGWWTTEFYLDGQKTDADSALFTGYLWENRFRPLMREHWLNPVLYVEFEHLNGADKTMQEIVGFDSVRDGDGRNAILREEGERELETRLILSSNFRGWNASENFLAVKNLGNEPWEFGYAIGVNRPLALTASQIDCRLCAENFRAGVEFYGGLGTWHRFGLSGTSQYVAPVLSWEWPEGLTLRVSPSFGLTPDSHRFLLRFGASYELAGFGSRIGRLFRK
jgi:hypothetical protein